MQGCVKFKNLKNGTMSLQGIIFRQQLLKINFLSIITTALIYYFSWLCLRKVPDNFKNNYPKNSKTTARYKKRPVFFLRFRLIQSSPRRKILENAVEKVIAARDKRFFRGVENYRAQVQVRKKETR